MILPESIYHFPAKRILIYMGSTYTPKVLPIVKQDLGKVCEAPYFSKT